MTHCQHFEPGDWENCSALNRFSEDERTLWGELRSSFAHIDFGLSVGPPKRGVQQAIELGRKYDIIHLDTRIEISMPAEK